MKKLLSFLLCIIVILGLTSCNLGYDVDSPTLTIDGDLLSWSSVDADFYSLRIMFDDVNGYEIETTETNYKAKFVKEGQYSFTVRANKNGNYSKYSNTVTYTLDKDIAITPDDNSSIIYRGSGTADDPILIESSKHLLAINTGTKKEVVNGITQTYSLYYKQTCDIDLNGEDVSPICTGSNKFQGYYDGDGYTISNFKQNTIPSSGYIYMGLFGSIEGASIINLNVTGYYCGISSSTKGFAVGAIAGYAKESVIENVSVQGVIKINSPSNTNYFGYAGMLVGQSYGTNIVRCEAKGEINVTFAKVFAGGLCGSTNTGTKDVISNCISTTKITAHATGRNAGVIEASSYAGGLIGYASSFSIVENSVSDSELKATAIDGADALNVGIGIFGGGKHRSADGLSSLIYNNCYFNYQKMGLALSSDYQTVDLLVDRFAIGGATVKQNSTTTVFGFNDEQSSIQDTFSQLDFDNIWLFNNGVLSLKDYKATHRNNDN